MSITQVQIKHRKKWVMLSLCSSSGHIYVFHRTSFFYIFFHTDIYHSPLKIEMMINTDRMLILDKFFISEDFMCTFQQISQNLRKAQVFKFMCDSPERYSQGDSNGYPQQF